MKTCFGLIMSLLKMNDTRKKRSENKYDDIMNLIVDWSIMKKEAVFDVSCYISRCRDGTA